MTTQFQQLDTNKDGKLSLAEFGGPADDLKFFDKNGDGLIDMTEWNAALAQAKTTAEDHADKEADALQSQLQAESNPPPPPPPPPQPSNSSPGLLETDDLPTSSSDSNHALVQVETKTGEISGMCWKNSYDRGIGTIPPYCAAPNTDKQAGLCYVPCGYPYYGVGPVCWQYCDSAYYTDIGVGCDPKKNWGSCPWYDTCCLWHDPTCGRYGPGWFWSAGYCACIHGWYYTKGSYGRGAGLLPSVCEAGRENQAGLCYQNCKPGYYGLVTVCWQSCGGDEYPVDCGVPCTSSAETCAAVTTTITCASAGLFACLGIGAFLGIGAAKICGEVVTDCVLGTSLVSHCPDPI